MARQDRTIKRADMIFVTGGAGYIGSHTCVELLRSGFEVTVFDNFCNSSPLALKQVERIAGKAPSVVRGDVRDGDRLRQALAASGARAVIHFAGLKAVGESCESPLRYYENNLLGTVNLLSAMSACAVHHLVFSSSATVYGAPQYLPVPEDHQLSATNPYGRSKLMIEDVLRDCMKANGDWRFAILRYFNPAGAHESGLIGENPRGTPNNLMPFVSQVADGLRPYLTVFGTDYPTPDGTGVRDYLHVVDLARGHRLALEYLQTQVGSLTVNLGTGQGHSVLELVNAFEAASGRQVPLRFAPRRAGDVAVCYADRQRAADLLGWRAERNLELICCDGWRWQRQHSRSLL